jgi:hypothetical protein
MVVGDPNSQVSNEFVCVPFEVESGSDTPGDELDNTLVFTVENDTPSMARTIGFWKNWTSCDGSGNQDPVLDETLALADDSNGNTVPDIRIGDLYVETCMQAVKILAKTPINGTKNRASDPAFNVAAQLLAYHLNLLLGAPDNCNAANVAAAKTQFILDQIGFNGLSSFNFNFKSATGKQIAANLNYLNGFLDAYNNATLNCASSVTPPYPNVPAGLNAVP